MHRLGYHGINTLMYPDVYVVHKSTEHWVWVVYFVVIGNKLRSKCEKYIKKRIQWQEGVPFIVFNTHAFYLNHRLRLPKELGVIES